MQKLTLTKKTTAIFTLLALIAGSFGLASFQVAHAAGTYTIPQEAPAYTINPSATGVDTLKAFIETPGVTFANPGFTSLDAGWTASTINPTYAVETGPSSALLTENLNIAVGATAVTVNVYAFTNSTLTDAYKVTFTDGNYNGFTTDISATTLAGENTTPPAVLASVVTNSASAITSTGATLNGTNGPIATDANGEAFWYGTTVAGPFVSEATDASSQNTGSWTTALADTTNLAAQGSFSLTTTTLTPSTKYYFVAWSLVNGVWYPGAVSNFTTSAISILPGTLAAQDFGVMNVSNVKGYTAGFGVTDATLAGATSVVTKLYSGNTLLQTDTAIIPKFNTDITGTQFSSPFDVFGTFSYPTDGYWTNVRAAEYGQTLIPTKVIATVTLANGKVVTAENDVMTGDTTTIFPVGTGTISGTVTSDSGLSVDSITASPNNANGIADGSYTHGWSYVFHITAPTNEPNLSMKFADWLNGANILPVANNMRISSAQATITTPTTLTAKNLYSSPVLVMTGDLDGTKAGRQVEVLVEVQIPVSTVNGSYSTSYGINTN